MGSDDRDGGRKFEFSLSKLVICIFLLIALLISIAYTVICDGECSRWGRIVAAVVQIVTPIIFAFIITPVCGKKDHKLTATIAVSELHNIYQSQGSLFDELANVIIAEDNLDTLRSVDRMQFVLEQQRGKVKEAIGHWTEVNEDAGRDVLQRRKRNTDVLRQMESERESEGDK